MKFLFVSDILTKLENAIRFKLPFCHVRFGDGGLKFLHAILFKDQPQLSVILKKEGIPFSKVLDIFYLWGKCARLADCIDTPEVYLNGSFWERVKKENKPINQTTKTKLQMWRYLYRQSEFDNEVFCNPESNYLMILRDLPLTIVDLMRKYKICIVTARPEVKAVLSNYGIKKVDIIPIVGQWQEHYNRCFKKVMKEISRTAKYYDFWIISAGEIGRIYSGHIKECGGRSVDLGFVVDFWVDNQIHPRLLPFAVPSISSKLLLTLTWKGKKYLKNI